MCESYWERFSKDLQYWEHMKVRVAELVESSLEIAPFREYLEEISLHCTIAAPVSDVRNFPLFAAVSFEFD